MVEQRQDASVMMACFGKWKEQSGLQDRDLGGRMNIYNTEFSAYPCSSDQTAAMNHAPLYIRRPKCKEGIELQKCSKACNAPKSSHHYNMPALLTVIFASHFAPSPPRQRTLHAHTCRWCRCSDLWRHHAWRRYALSRRCSTDACPLVFLLSRGNRGRARNRC